MSRTNIVLDEGLVDEALRLTHLKTKKDVVNYALRDLVKKMKRKGILKLEGKVEWIGSLDEMRKSRV
ncbi:MAG: type II toxin-antitoxin system VapB family antitoxin [Candidatus Omnitrophica bacterium]|nr:type II toxin-antitoxin system VapB family antitoxin [Candidatus Omnitrophota bacterium]